MSTLTLESKVAIITPLSFRHELCAGGIGLATAKRFLESSVLGLVLVDLKLASLESALVVLNAPTSEDRVLLKAADVSSENDTASYVASAMEKWGRVDISVQCAGICEAPSSFIDADGDAWDRIMSVNARGGSTPPAMLRNTERDKGAIVVISSQLGLEGAPGLAAYSASKFAARGLALTAALELGPKGIRVNTVCPGPIETPLLEAFEEPDSEPHSGPRNTRARSDLASKTVLGRLGSPEEIASMVLFLVSGMGAYCVGTTIKVDGGYSKFG
ncbi:hypothetical protein BD779DRAFT_1569639 [Infundibulicybe gibba]|nr:hypothetical protein BD779DRAFT_1569639 [Infundibulicybe gibba]